MATILGIESTAHTFGIGVVENGKVLSNVKDSYTTEKGGIIPTDAAEHHKKVAHELYLKVLQNADIKEKDINAIAFSIGPGLAPCLLEGIKFAKEISRRLRKPLVPVNHCIAHLEIGKITGAKDPVLLYVSGANTQIIAYASGKYRIFGETLDLGVGNFIDTFARYAGIGFPGGAKIQELAEKSSKNYIELPYSVKGMDIALSGILTNLKQKLEKINLHSPKARELIATNPPSAGFSDKSLLMGKKNSGKIKPSSIENNNNLTYEDNQIYVNNSKKSRTNVNERFGEGEIKIINNQARSRAERVYTLPDLAFSMQETVFAMLVETAERALAHTGKNELLLGGGVCCNKRLQEMCRIMCEERGAKFFVPENQYLIDNGAMIAFLGEIMFSKDIKFQGKEIDKLDILPRQRTDDVDVRWR